MLKSHKQVKQEKKLTTQNKQKNYIHRGKHILMLPLLNPNACNDWRKVEHFYMH